jgi:hypothetical protein
MEWRVSKWLLSGYSAWLYQPPLEGLVGASEEKLRSVEATGQNLEALVGSQEAYRFTPPSSAWSKVAKIEAFLPPSTEGEGDERAEEKEDWSGFGDGVGFPKFRVAREGTSHSLLLPLCFCSCKLTLLPLTTGPLRGRGLRFTDLMMQFPLPIVVQD